MKKNLSLLFFFALFFFFSSKVFADNNFSTNYDVIYSVASNENTNVLIDIELKNKTSDYYAASYTVQTGFREINNIKASDSSGSMNYKTKKSDMGTQISLNFNSNAVGLDNVQEFKISFDTKEVAKSNGSVWEVNIPGLSNQSDYEEFNVIINVPDFLGSPVIIKPQIKDLRTSKNSLYFSKSDLGESGVSISYGENQIYEFNLRYHLKNPKLFPIQTEIAIPSNNNYQEVRIEDIIPKPNNVYIDKDGNWLAKYRLSAGEDLNAEVTGHAKVSYKPRRETLTQEQKNLFLSSKKYWESDNESIKKLASVLKTPEAIYRYVVENLKYDAKRIKDVQVRAGANGVLRNKNSAVCLEFTDLFIALARSAGIPARAVEGYANTNNSAERPLSLLKDILHSWPEYYDFEKKAWIMVDPTWENTTGGLDYFNVFDFDHFAFVIKGENSEYPVPAGGYKIPGNENIKDVSVSISKTYGFSSPSLNASTNFSEKYLSGFPVEGKIVIENLSGVISPNQTIQINSDNLKPMAQSLYLDKIPPFGKKIIPVRFNSESILTNKAGNIKIRIGEKTIDVKVLVSPFYKNIYFILGGIIIGSIIVILSALIRKSRRLHVS